MILDFMNANIQYINNIRHTIFIKQKKNEYEIINIYIIDKHLNKIEFIICLFII